jgi:hypothetical protein
LIYFRRDLSGNLAEEVSDKCSKKQLALIKKFPVKDFSLTGKKGEEVIL